MALSELNKLQKMEISAAVPLEAAYVVENVKYTWKQQKLCCFNQENPHISAFGHHTELKQSIPRWMSGSQLSKYEFAGQSRLPEKYRKLQQNPETIDELKSVLQTFWEELPHERINEAEANFPSSWLPTWLWLPMVVTPDICSNYVHLQVFILISSPTNRLFHSRKQIIGKKQRSERW